MQIPTVSPVGLLETPSDYRAPPRRYGRVQRFVAALVAAGFLVTMLATGVATLARYCLTSHAGSPLPTALFDLTR